MLRREWLHSLWMLMERQYPIDGTANPLRLKSAVDYAQNLNIHVNSLNRALKTVTGKTTSELIANRIIQEAKALLNHTDWNINEIAFSCSVSMILHILPIFSENKPDYHL